MAVVSPRVELQIQLTEYDLKGRHVLPASGTFFQEGERRQASLQFSIINPTFHTTFRLCIKHRQVKVKHKLDNLTL